MDDDIPLNEKTFPMENVTSNLLCNESAGTLGHFSNPYIPAWYLQVFYKIIFFYFIFYNELLGADQLR